MKLTTLRKADGTIVCTRCALAVNPWTRFRGLMGRRSRNLAEPYSAQAWADRWIALLKEVAVG